MKEGVKLITHRDLAGRLCSAVFSDDKAHRLEVAWEWGTGPKLTCCLLNPAMLEAHEPDHTGAAIVARATRWGYKGARIVNLFTFRTPDPAVMKAHPEPNHKWADGYITRAMKDAAEDGSPFVVGWGRDGDHRNRADEIVALATQVGIPLMAFQINQDGSPTHPARLAYDLPLLTWRPA